MGGFLGDGLDFELLASRLAAADGADDDGASWNFAWQLGAGVRMAVAPTTTIDLGYRYKSTTADAEDFGFPFDNDADADAHVFQLGVTFGF